MQCATGFWDWCRHLYLVIFVLLQWICIDIEFGHQDHFIGYHCCTMLCLYKLGHPCWPLQSVSMFYYSISYEQQFTWLIYGQAMWIVVGPSEGWFKLHTWHPTMDSGVCLRVGGPLGHAPPLRTPIFTLDIGLRRKRVRERRSICRKIGFGPPQAISKHAPGWAYVGQLFRFVLKCLDSYIM